MVALLHAGDVWVFTFILAIVYPALDYWVYQRLTSAIKIYVWNILAAWTLTAAAIALTFRHHLTLSEFGQNFGSYPRTVIVCAILVVVILALYLVNKLQKRKASPEKLAHATERIRKLLPKSAAERRMWIVVSITAGFCEEFLYRGWLLHVSAAACHSVWIGLALSSLFFGLAHVYQGRSAIVSTGVLGVVFGVIYIASRTLLPSQIVHTFLDITNGLAFARIPQRGNPAQARRGFTTEGTEGTE